MADRLIQGATLQDIGNAIREKTNTTGAITPGNMPSMINGISGGDSSGTSSSGRIRFVVDSKYPYIYNSGVNTGHCDTATTLTCPDYLFNNKSGFIYFANATTSGARIIEYADCPLILVANVILPVATLTSGNTWCNAKVYVANIVSNNLTGRCVDLQVCLTASNGIATISSNVINYRWVTNAYTIIHSSC